MRILVVENDHRVARALTRTLRAAGHEVERATSVAGARDALTHGFDFALVDLGLDDGDGVEVIRALREHPATGVIAVTARGAESDRVRGLRSGADDYLVKPFGAGELLARIDAVRRRVRAAPAEAEPREPIRHGHLVLDRDRHEVSADGEPVSLTHKEFEILALLMRTPGVVVPRDRILEHVWQSTWEGSTRTLDTHMASLRAKVADRGTITTVRGLGYRLENDGS